MDYRVQIFRRSEFHLFSDLARTMLEDRKAIFMDGLKWDALHANHMGWERDEYDDITKHDAFYVALEDKKTGLHLASGRLLPTNRPHMIADHFNDLTGGVRYSGPRTWELTRLCIAPLGKLRSAGISPREAGKFIDTLALAGHEFASVSGIDNYVGIMDRLVYHYYQKNHYNVEKFGAPHPDFVMAAWNVAEMPVAALATRIENADQVLHNVRQFFSGHDNEYMSRPIAPALYERNEIKQFELRRLNSNGAGNRASSKDGAFRQQDFQSPDGGAYHVSPAF